MKFYDSAAGIAFDVDAAMVQGVISEINNSHHGMGLGDFYAHINEIAEKSGLPPVISYEGNWLFNEFNVLNVNVEHTNFNGEPIIILDFNLERKRIDW